MIAVRDMPAPPSTPTACNSSRDVIDTAVTDRGSLVVTAEYPRVAEPQCARRVRRVRHQEDFMMPASGSRGRRDRGPGELRSVALQSRLADMATVVVTSTVLGDALFAAARRPGRRTRDIRAVPARRRRRPGRGERQPPGADHDLRGRPAPCPPIRRTPRRTVGSAAALAGGLRWRCSPW